EGIAFPVSVRAAAFPLHARQLYGDAVALHDHEDRWMLEVGTDFEAEPVAVILRRAHDIRDQKMRGYPFRFRRHRRRPDFSSLTTLPCSDRQGSPAAIHRGRVATAASAAAAASRVRLLHARSRARPRPARCTAPRPAPGPSSRGI